MEADASTNFFVLVQSAQNLSYGFAPSEIPEAKQLSEE